MIIKVEGTGMIIKVIDRMLDINYDEKASHDFIKGYMTFGNALKQTLIEMSNEEGIKR